MSLESVRSHLLQKHWGTVHPVDGDPGGFTKEFTEEWVEEHSGDKNLHLLHLQDHRHQRWESHNHEWINE